MCVPVLWPLYCGCRQRWSPSLIILHQKYPLASIGSYYKEIKWTYQGLPEDFELSWMVLKKGKLKIIIWVDIHFFAFPGSLYSPFQERETHFPTEDLFHVAWVEWSCLSVFHVQRHGNPCPLFPSHRGLLWDGSKNQAVPIRLLPETWD